MRWQKAKARQLKTLSYFGRWFGCLWRSVGLAGLSARLGAVLSSVSSCGLMISGGAPFVWMSLAWIGRLCCAPCPGTCAGCGRLLVRVSALLILRAVYCLYIPALRNLTGFCHAKIRFWITSIIGKTKSFMRAYTCYKSFFLIRVWSL